MLKVRIIPCLDVKDGRVVKGVNFVDLVDAGDPVEQARLYDREGADELCFLDITASSENRDTLFDVVGRTAEQCFMPLTVGGGVRRIEDIRKLLLAGADKVSINTEAVRRPEFVREAAGKFGSQCITVAIDAKRNAAGGFLAALVERPVVVVEAGLAPGRLGMAQQQQALHRTGMPACRSRALASPMR